MTWAFAVPCLQLPWKFKQAMGLQKHLTPLSSFLQSTVWTVWWVRAPSWLLHAAHPPQCSDCDWLSSPSHVLRWDLCIPLPVPSRNSWEVDRFYLKHFLLRSGTYHTFSLKLTAQDDTPFYPGKRASSLSSRGALQRSPSLSFFGCINKSVRQIHFFLTFSKPQN